MTSLDDTIAAPASAAGPALRGIIRVSGGDVRRVVETCFQPDDARRWSSARAALVHSGRFRPSGFSVTISGTVSFWPTARSFTGQPVAELHVVGSPPVIEALLEALYASGARPAQPGEFTLRAFLSGRIDLVQAEAVLGVIDAEEPLQLQKALAQLAGGISTQIALFREQLLLHLADLEAGLDFVDEDIEFVSRDTLRTQMDEALAFLQRLLGQSDQRMQSTGRRAVVLAGIPNAGKSTLFNTLTDCAAAIVSPQSGTTRDILVRSVQWHGVAIDLYDTAGCETSIDPVMAQAEALRQERLQSADLVVWCHPPDASGGLRSADLPTEWMTVATKADLTKADRPPNGLQVSAQTGAGIESLKQAIVERLQSGTDSDGELISSTAARCRNSLQRAFDSLQRARAAVDESIGDELISMELRTALDELGEICGAVYTDDILDRIFSRFCIGK